jgi:hypothetical protein
MQTIPVDVSKIIFIAMEGPKPKLRNRKTGEQSVDRDGRPVHVIRCACVPADESSDAVPEIEAIHTIADVPSLRRGAPVQVSGLVARPWAFQDDSGKERSGVTFWAEQITQVNGRAGGA